jgi:uncharacterized ferritin-like protein (DUF455 family)
VNNIFDFAATCLFSSDIRQKITATHQARQLLDENGLSFADEAEVLPIGHARFPAKPECLPARDMPRRRLDTAAGKAAFFHALAHIEFVAIYLAWDIIYRFRGLPAEFYRDWLIIADEEAQHFSLLSEHLQGLGFAYGDLPAHRGLWLYAEETAMDILARLAVVPRCMEARGLDVTPGMIDKLRALDDQAGVAILTRIYQDEIGHVERGSYWFQRLAQERGRDAEQCYTEMILKHVQGKPKGPFNREVRIIAGFTHNEIDWLEER